VSLKNILACDSTTLLITPKYYDFYLRGLVPQQHYWPVRADKLCDSIQFAVNWGNKHTKEVSQVFHSSFTLGKLFPLLNTIFKFGLLILRSQKRLERQRKNLF
jgi:hypothetical protein